ncbi:Protein N-lysine methyltransferase FAM173B,Protein N-lysine methyltransferase FAM173A [Mytilus edulis]|uniref:Protein N-lysine methyltransferase FAM173B,Protein N-lysine methyltransferase FAM173A n=2 Tax=Mytilus edulis TaxID=6550 RepID=A0A8S3VQG7_MYTED|nr:Protein N-lysine methyltransferase FAM173B,Protein N-lysine methyltransferase FAM173A [Mytilus edulis]
MGLTEADLALGKPPAKLSSTGKVIVGVIGGLVAGVYVAALPFVVPAFRKVCLPFVPASESQVRNVLSALKGRKGTLLDIGSGDGRIVIEAAKVGFRGTGVELNPWLVLFSRWNARRNKVHKLTTFQTKDLWKTNVGSYNNISIFGVESMMDRLETKFENETNNDVRIVACRFPLPNWEPIETIGEGIDTVWLYKKQ